MPPSGIENPNKMKKTTLLAMAAMVAAVSLAEPYTRLFRVVNTQGDCRVRRPDAEAFEPVQRNKAYPFGTKIECGEDSSAVLLFSETDAVRMLADTRAVVTIESEEGKDTRVVTLVRGTLLTRVGAGTTEDFVVIDTPAGRVRAITGNCKISMERTRGSRHEPATVDVEFRAEPAGKMKIVGRQFIIPVLKNGFGARVSSYEDDSYTVVTDLLGDYGIFVNTGLDADPPEPYEENQSLNRIKMSTKAALRIWRQKAEVGDTTVVAVLATNSAGKGRESFAFAVGKADIAARSNVFIETLTNDLAAAEQSKADYTQDGAAQDGSQGSSDDDFGDFSLPADGAAPADSGDSTGGDSTSGDALFDFLI